MAKIEFEIDTHEYERAHARLPRGKGNWAIEARVSRQGAWTTETVWCNGLLREAIAAAKTKVRSEIGGAEYCRLAVLP